MNKTEKFNNSSEQQVMGIISIRNDISGKKTIIIRNKTKKIFLKGNLKHKQKKKEKKREINVDKRTLVTKGQQ